MTNNTSFPSTEPPPYPGIQGTAIDTINQPAAPQGQVLDPKLTSAMTPADTQSSFDVIPTSAGIVNSLQPNAQPVPLQGGVPFLPPKKTMSKILPIILGVFGLLIVITIVMIFFRREKPVNLVGTKGELTWWGVENEEFIVKPLIDEYVNKNPNVKITYIKQSKSDYRERLVNSLAQGKGPDIFEIHNSWVPMFRSELSTAPGDVITSDTYVKTYYPVISRDFTASLGIVGIPLEYDALTFFYNQDIFDSAAITPPETWDNVADVAESLTQRSGKDVILQSGVALGLTNNIDYWQDIVALMIFQNSAHPGEPSEEVFDALAFYTSFTTDLKVWNSTLPSSVSAFAKNKLAMLFGPSSVAKEIILENPNLRFKTAILPQLPKNTPTDPDYSYATYWAQSVWKRSRNSEVAWDFLEYLSTSESLQKMNQIRKSKNVLEKAYPRLDMAILQKEDKILGSVLALANNAVSWYLYDKTNDGQTGINTQVAIIYNDAINSVFENKDTKKLVGPLATSVKTLLSKYTVK